MQLLLLFAENICLMMESLLLEYKLFKMLMVRVSETTLSYDVASGSEITPCNKIDRPLIDKIITFLCQK